MLIQNEKTPRIYGDRKNWTTTCCFLIIVAFGTINVNLLVQSPKPSGIVSELTGKLETMYCMMFSFLVFYFDGMSSLFFLVTLSYITSAHGFFTLFSSQVTTKPILVYPNSGESYDPDIKEWVVSSFSLVAWLSHGSLLIVFIQFYPKIFWNQ